MQTEIHPFGRILRRLFLCSLVAAIALQGFQESGSYAQKVYTYERPVPAPKDQDAQRVREARNKLALILYKRQNNLFDYRYLSEDELLKLQREAAMSAADTAAVAMQLREAAALLPVERSFAEELKTVIKETGTQLSDELEKYKAPGLSSSGDIENVYNWLQGNNGAAIEVIKGNIEALKTIENLGRESVLEERRNTVEPALSDLNRKRLEWQIAISRVKAGTDKDTSNVQQAEKTYRDALADVRNKTGEYRQLVASQKNLQSAVRMHQEMLSGYEKLQTVSKSMKKIGLLAGDGSAKDTTLALLDVSDSLTESVLSNLKSLQAINAQAIASDKKYLHETILKQRFSTSGGPTYLNQVLQNLPTREGDQAVLDAAVKVAQKARSIQMFVNRQKPRVEFVGDLIYNAWEEYNRVNPYSDVQSAETQAAVNYFGRLSEALLKIPDLLKHEGVTLPSPIVGILEYAGRVAGTLPVLVNSFSASKSRLDQFTSLPSGWKLPSGGNAPFLKSRHMFLHEIGLQAYADLAGNDQQTVYVPQRRPHTGFVKLQPGEFQEVLRAMSVFSTLTGRNPTQDEFLALCESSSKDLSDTSRSTTFYYVDLDPTVPEYFHIREMSLTIHNLLGKTHRVVLENDRYADKFGGLTLFLCMQWNEALGNIKDPLDYKKLVETKLSLFGDPYAVNRDRQLVFTRFSRKYEELNELFRSVYFRDVTPNVLGAAVIYSEEGPGPIEQKLIERRNRMQAESAYTVDVAVSQPEFDSLDFLISHSAPKNAWPKKITTTLQVTLPGGESDRNLTLRPFTNAEGRSVLRGELKDIPLQVLARGGSCSYQIDVSFDGVEKTQTGRIELQDLLSVSKALALPDLTSGSFDTYEFSTVMYHHPEFQPSSGKMKPVLEVRKPGEENREIEGHFRFDRKWGDSLSLVSTKVDVNDREKWPPGNYDCRLAFHFGDYVMRTPYAAFTILDLDIDSGKSDTEKKPDDKKNEKDDDNQLVDPTGPLRVAAIRAANLLSQATALLKEAGTAVSEADSALSGIEQRATEVNNRLDDIQKRIAAVNQRLPGVKTLADKIRDAALKSVEAKQKATKFANAACLAADRARQAETADDVRQRAAEADANLQNAIEQLLIARREAETARKSAAILKQIVEDLRSLPREIAALMSAATKLTDLLELARSRIAEARNLQARLEGKTERLAVLKNEAAGLLAAGKAQMAPFRENPQAGNFIKIMEGLYSQVDSAAKRAGAFPASLKVLIEESGKRLDGPGETIKDLLARIQTPALPQVDDMDGLLSALATFDVADIWVARAEAEVVRAAGCASIAGDVPLPEPKPDSLEDDRLTKAPGDATLDGLDSDEITRVKPESTLDGLEGDEITRTKTKSPLDDLKGDEVTRSSGKSKSPPRTKSRPTKSKNPEKPAPKAEEERAFVLYTVDKKTRRLKPFFYQMKWTVIDEKTAKATLFLPGRFAGKEAAQLKQLGIAQSIEMQAVLKNGRYEARSADLKNFARVGAAIGVAIGEEVGEQIGGALTFGFGDKDDDKNTPKTTFTVNDAALYITPRNGDLSVIFHSNITLSIPGKPRKVINNNSDLVGKPAR